MVICSALACSSLLASALKLAENFERPFGVRPPLNDVSMDGHSGHARRGSVTSASRFLIGCSPVSPGTTTFRRRAPRGAGWSHARAVTRRRLRFGTQVQPAGLARIDRDRYTILAIDLKVDGEVTAVIYAIDRVAHEISVPAKIVDLGQRKGEISVVEFQLPHSTVEDSPARLQKDLDPVGDSGPSRPDPGRHRVESRTGWSELRSTKFRTQLDDLSI